jgi:hypothetical protein
MKNIGVAIVLIALVLMPVSAGAQAGAASSLQGFSIVLVQGDLQSGAATESVPPAAQAALNDLKDFLPYKSYRVLDTAWVIASSASRQEISTRLRGPDEQDHEVILNKSQDQPSSPLRIAFVMREPGADQSRREDAAHLEAQLKSELMQLAASHAALEYQLRQTQDPGNAAALRQRLSETEIAMETRKHQLRAPNGGSTLLIDTTFNMALGETVVVGTSRMRGGSKALIVLLTAVTRGAKK